MKPYHSVLYIDIALINFNDLFWKNCITRPVTAEDEGRVYSDGGIQTYL